MIGWDHSPARFGVRYLLETYESRSLETIAVLVPGRRAGRLLFGELVRVAGGDQGVVVPPQLLTPSTLVEAFFERVDEMLPASDPMALLAWREALSHEGDARDMLYPGAPHGRDPRETTARARRLRRVCEELDSIGLSIRELLQRSAAMGSPQRWEALDVVRAGAHERLQGMGRMESTLMRRRMIEAGVLRADAPRELLVLAVSDPGALACATFQALGDRCRILVDAPESEAESFDWAGRPSPEAWANRPSVIPMDRIEVVDRPLDAAEQVLADLDEMHGLDGPIVPSKVAIGLCDESFAGVLERAGRRVGVPLRASVGWTLDRGELGALLEGLYAHSTEPSLETFAALLRMPSVEDLLLAANEPEESTGTPDLVELLDRWRADRIGGSLEDLRAGRSGTDSRLPVGVLRRALARFEALIDPLREATTIHGWVDALVTFLRATFAPREDDSNLLEEFDALTETLSLLREVPQESDVNPGSGALIDVALGALGARTRTPGALEGAIELLGWLEMHHEGAEDVILVGVNESGELLSRIGDPWLPDSLRTAIGLGNESTRWARDVHAMHALANRSRSLRAIVARHNGDGDPIAPSRLVLACEGTELAERVMATIDGPARTTPDGLLAGTPPPAKEAGFVPARPPAAPRIERLRVTDFASWIRSPMDFWLERLEQLEEPDPTALELDALRFGSLVHAVLEAFGRDELKGSADAGRISRFLVDRLDAMVADAYGARPAPAIAFQRATLRGRLERFAVVQAASINEGWSIHEVEFLLDEMLDVPGEEPVRIRGRIDRIDRHEDGRLRLLDYKSSEKPVRAAEKRKSDGTWLDLQLPLYDHLLRRQWSLGEDPIELGYVALPTDLAQVRIEIADTWTPEVLAEGVEQARMIVRAMRAGRFEEAERPRGPKPKAIDRILRTSVLELEGTPEHEEDAS